MILLLFYHTSEQNTFTSKDVNAAKCGDIYIVSAQRCRTEKLSSASKKNVIWPNGNLSYGALCECERKRVYIYVFKHSL